MKNNDKRKYIKRKMNEAVISDVESVEVDFLEDKLYQIHLVIAEKLGDLEKLERELEVIKDEAERLTIRRDQAIANAEKRKREFDRDY